MTPLKEVQKILALVAKLDADLLRAYPDPGQSEGVDDLRGWLQRLKTELGVIATVAGALKSIPTKRPPQVLALPRLPRTFRESVRRSY